MVSDPKHDFGVMSPGEDGERAFTIKNVGNEPLTLRVGATSCKCTLGSLAKDSIQPGEQTEVTLSWKINTDSSEFSQTAQLHTNDPTNPVINLAVSGRIVRDIEMVPRSLSFGEVASGEPIELTAKVYSYIDGRIQPTETRFSNDEMTKLSTFQVDEYEPNQDDDGIYADAKQAFRVKVAIEPGLKQGAVSQNLVFGFRNTPDGGDTSSDPSPADGDLIDGMILAATTGRIVGPLSMIPNPKLTGRQGGGYIYDFGRLGKGDSLIGKAFVVLKGSQRENTELTIGDVTPAGVIDAKLGEPLGKGSMTLYPLELTLVPGKEPIERLGQNRDDYAMVWIESDNKDVPKMRIGVKFAIPSADVLAK